MTNKTINVLLSKALRWNAGFSFVSGILLILLGSTLSDTFGLINGILLQIVGTILLIFAIQLRVFSNNPEKQRLVGWYASANDIFWVLGSIVILIWQPTNITPIGNFLILAIAIVVSYFATLQLYAIAVEVSSYELSREVEIPSVVLWPIISDVEGFVRYADGLSSTKIIKGEKEGMIRRCHDLKNQVWNESCVSWIEGEKYSMEVDTTEYPYPFKKFQGTWSVKSLDDENSLITLRYDYIPKYGIVGKIMTNRMFSRMAPKIINDIIDNYLDEAQRLQIPA